MSYYGTSVRRSQGSGEIAQQRFQVVMVMELCETTLRTQIVGKQAKNPGKLGESELLQKTAMQHVAHYVTQIASALMYLHERALVHRDLKPQNILVNCVK